MVKIRPGLRPGRSCEKKSITRTRQQKSHKSVIFHIFGGKTRKGIAMKFGRGVDVHETVTWAEFDLENLMGVNFTGGQLFWASPLTLPMDLNIVYALLRYL